MMEGLKDWQAIILAVIVLSWFALHLRTWLIALIDVVTILAAAAIVAEVRREDFGELRLMLEIIKSRQGED